uniref:Uncharacterized protein n=1 Tax=Hyaloperonospora arabidopsidis (strain Emoy2) TaxID=559515 RepID=M4BZM4_HYAAE
MGRLCVRPLEMSSLSEAVVSKTNDSAGLCVKGKMVKMSNTIAVQFFVLNRAALDQQLSVSHGHHLSDRASGIVPSAA